MLSRKQEDILSDIEDHFEEAEAIRHLFNEVEASNRPNKEVELQQMNSYLSHAAYKIRQLFREMRREDIRDFLDYKAYRKMGKLSDGSDVDLDFDWARPK